MSGALAIVLARSGSTRLPGKMRLPLGRESVVERVLRKARTIPGVDAVVLATTTSSGDDVFLETARRLDVPVFRGSENDVVARMHGAVREHAPHAGAVVRVCADNPLFDPSLAGEALREVERGADMVTPFEAPTLPFGASMAVLGADCLERIHAEAAQPMYREHVENFCLDNAGRFAVRYQVAPHAAHLPELVLTLDYPEDYRRLLFLDYLKRERSGDQGMERLVRAVLSCRVALGGVAREHEPGMRGLVERVCGLEPWFAPDAAAMPGVDLAICAGRPERIVAPRGAVWVKRDASGPCGLAYGHPDLDAPYAVLNLPGKGMEAGDYLAMVLPAVLKRLLAGFPPRAGAHEMALPSPDKMADGASRKGFREPMHALFPPCVLWGEGGPGPALEAEVRFWESAGGRAIARAAGTGADPLPDPFAGLRVSKGAVLAWDGAVVAEAAGHDGGPTLAEIWQWPALQRGRARYMNGLCSRPMGEAVDTPRPVEARP